MAIPNTAVGSIPRGKVVLLTGGYDHTVRFWEVHSGLSFRTMQYPDSPINLIRVSPDRRFFAVAGNPQTRIFRMDMSNPGHIHQLEGHTTNVAFGVQSEVIFTGSEDSLIKGWDLRAGGQAQQEFKCAGPVNAVALHPTRPLLATGDLPGRLRLWDLVAGRCIRDLAPEGDSSIRNICFSQDGSTMAAVNNAGSLFVWRLPAAGGGGSRSARPAAEANGVAGQAAEGAAAEGGGAPVAAAAATDSAAAAAEEEGDAELPEMSQAKQVAAHKTYALRCAMSPDGKYLATTSADHTAKIWSVASLAPVHTLVGHQKWVWDCAFSADSNFLITGSSDNTARSWNVAQGDTICHFTGHHKAVVSLALCEGVA